MNTNNIVQLANDVAIIKHYAMIDAAKALGTGIVILVFVGCFIVTEIRFWAKRR